MRAIAAGPGDLVKIIKEKCDVAQRADPDVGPIVRWKETLDEKSEWGEIRNHECHDQEFVTSVERTQVSGRYFGSFGSRGRV